MLHQMALLRVMPCQDKVPCLQVTKTFSERISQYTQTVVEALAYAGTGDVLRVQHFLSLAGDHIEVEEDALWKVSRQLGCHGFAFQCLRHGLCSSDLQPAMDA